MNANNQLLFTACATCGQRVTGDSIHTCSPQLKELTDEEITDALIEWAKVEHKDDYSDPTPEELAPIMRMARAILRKASEK